MRFLGAAGTVTGSRDPVNTPAGAVLVRAGAAEGHQPLGGALRSSLPLHEVELG